MVAPSREFQQPPPQEAFPQGAEEQELGEGDIEVVEEVEELSLDDLRALTLEEIDQASDTSALEQSANEAIAASAKSIDLAPAQVDAVADRTGFKPKSTGLFGKIKELAGTAREVLGGKEKQESREISEGQESIEAFKQFVGANEGKVDEQLKQGKELRDIFYDNFYNKPKGEPIYKEGDPKAWVAEQTYNDTVASLEQNLLQLTKEKTARGKQDLFAGTQGYWLHGLVNGGVGKESGAAGAGRLYFNLKPEQTASFFAKSLESFRAAGLHIQAKIPRKLDAHGLNRADKMVFYFNDDEEGQVLRIVEDLNKNNVDSFEDSAEIPNFTTKVKDSRGKTMSGIGFGEEPRVKGESFGAVRSDILSEVYQDAKSSGVSVSDKNFDSQASFIKACEKYGIDPESPAFNSSKEGKFNQIKKRSGK